MARIHFGRGVLFLALLFFVAHPELLRASDSPTVAVTGAILSEANNTRIANADAALCDAGGAVLQEFTAGDSGEFSFQGLRPGLYILRVQANGFQSAELHLDLSAASQPRRTRTRSRGASCGTRPNPTRRLPPAGYYPSAPEKLFRTAYGLGRLPPTRSRQPSRLARKRTPRSGREAITDLPCSNSFRQ